MASKADEAGVTQSAVEPETAPASMTPEVYEAVDGELVLPEGWIYKTREIGNWISPWYASPKVQLSVVSFVCFLCPGMFNALSSLGGGGKTDAKLADDMNTALYSTFAVFGFFGGTIVNKLGVKLTLSFGGLGYCIYAISLLASEHADVFGFNIFAGALLGLCAALLWTAQGTIMVSYPKEEDKGKYFAYFWAIFNMGAVIGSLIPLGQNFHTRTNSNVGDGTYIGFIVLMALGAVLALVICSARDVIRQDGTRVVLMKNPSWYSEFYGLYESITFQPSVILLFPMFWSSNWFYTYQQNAINGAHFDTRTKALNGCLYYLAQIVGAMTLGYALDYTSVASRSMRGKLAWGFLFTMTMVIWGGGYAFQKQYTRADTSSDDWTSSGYVGPMFLYIFYGMYDSFWQCTVYWYMGALSNSGRRTANYVGFYKGIQSAGAAVMWSLDSRKISFMAEFASNWALLSFSLLCAAPVVLFKISDHSLLEEDLQGTDETVADVLPANILAEKSAHPEEA
ncbi:probable DUF895 domain membrane protein [Phialocephala subalpina]|uniref:Probable DUF895 domain membrane protein n=1 Tax=Phialocephala subalpina TaxID=576137 RepID=A0A1L7XB68_9HELO|nr:probable DUF895 domain membrane protein [Phialocephala subalpina]